MGTGYRLTGPVQMLTPLPPAKTGIAHYSSMLIPALRQYVDVEPIAAPPVPGTRYPSPVYHLGNNPHHEWIYHAAMETPGVIVLHDLVLHHLIVEMTLARGDADAYADALRANHGAAGEAWARGRAAGLHSEMGNFLLPASVEVARRSRAVIVHNEWAADRLRSFGVTTPVHVVPHPFEPQPAARGRREEVRRQHGYAADARVIGLFGFLTSAKRADVILAAFAQARARDPRLRLLVVGEPAPNIDVHAFNAFQNNGITFTGYVDDAEFAAYFAAVDRLVNLRYPSAGETSGTLIRAFEAGKPVAVSDYAQFAELPNDCVVKIPFGETEVPQLAGFFTRDIDDPSEAQKKWLAENASMEKTVEGYLAALESTNSTQHPAPSTTSIPLFPSLELTRLEPDPLTLELENRGESTLRTREYGQPGYRLIVKLFDGATEIYDRWVELPRDLAAGERATVTLPIRGRGTLALYHAIEGIPMLEPEAFARAEI